MADAVLNTKTSLTGEEVIVRAVQFFSTEKWRATTQSSRVVTFQGRPPIPVMMIIFTVLGFMFCIIPGVIMYFMVIRKLIRFQNLVVTANPIPAGTEVSVSHPSWSAGLVKRYLQALPSLPAAAAPPPQG